MKLFELGGQFSRTDQSWGQYTEWLLRTHRLKPLGSGGSARVFPHPKLKEVAVKVVELRDTHYLKYLDWCEKHQSNPFVPKIHAVETFKHGSLKYSGYAIVFMERLNPISPAQYGKFLDDLEIGYHRFATGDQQEYLRSRIEMLKKSKRNAHVVQVLEFLANNFRAYDFHKGNFMMRGNQVVFIDPVGPAPGLTA